MELCRHVALIKRFYYILCLFFSNSNGEKAKAEVKPQAALFVWGWKCAQWDIPPDVYLLYNHILYASDPFACFASWIGFAYWPSIRRHSFSSNRLLGRPCSDSSGVQEDRPQKVMALSGNDYDGLWDSSSVQSLFGVHRFPGHQLVTSCLLYLYSSCCMHVI